MKSWHKHALVALLALLAAVRVFLFAAVFPFFSNGDEDLHFDLIVRYQAGHVPRSFEPISDDALNFIGVYASPEFLQNPDDFPNGEFPEPLWKQPFPEAWPVIQATKAAFAGEINWEASQPPLYYALSAFWWKAGQTFGLNGIGSLYWIRFLNPILMAVLVVIGFVAARTLAPECASLQLGTPLLLAFMPQDVFYVMSNDVLSPILFGTVFLCVLRWLSKPPTISLGAITGIAIATTYLTKLSNLPLLAAAVATIGATCFLPTHRPNRSTAGALILMTACAGVPIVAWMLWSRANFGDITGSAGRIAILDWTRKPFAQWWHHPIFSLGGLWTFWSELIARFWRGELMWQNREFQSPLIDNFYAISSLIFIGIALFTIRRGLLSDARSKALLFAAVSFFSAIAFFFLLSIALDFGRCIFPSRAHPYFTSGRLMIGALVPFALLYTYGLVHFIRRLGVGVPPWIAPAMIAAIASISEIAIKHDVFASRHNWFHL